MCYDVCREKGHVYSIYIAMYNNVLCTHGRRRNYCATARQFLMCAYSSEAALRSGWRLFDLMPAAAAAAGTN